MGVQDFRAYLSKTAWALGSEGIWVFVLELVCINSTKSSVKYDQAYVLRGRAGLITILYVCFFFIFLKKKVFSTAAILFPV